MVDFKLLVELLQGKDDSGKIIANVKKIDQSISKLEKTDRLAAIFKKANLELGKSKSGSFIKDLTQGVKGKKITDITPDIVKRLEVAKNEQQLDKAEVARRINTAKRIDNIEKEKLAKTRAIGNATIAAMKKTFSQKQALRKKETSGTITSPGEALVASQVKRGQFQPATEVVKQQADSADYKAETKKKIKATKDYVNNEKNASRKLQGFWGMNFLTFLFVGQAIKKIASQIATRSISAFTEVAGSGNAASNALTGMQIGFKAISVAIGEAIGSALLPFSEIIFNIMEGVIGWVSEHQKLVAAIVLGGIALGTFLILLAQFALVFNSIQGIVTTFKALTVVMAGTGPAAATLATIGTVLLWIAAIAAIFYLLWVSNLGGFREFIVETFGILWETVKSVFGDLWTLIKSIFGLIVVLLTGDTELIKESFLKIVDSIFRIFLKLFLGIGALVANLGIWVFNVLMDIIGIAIKLGSYVFAAMLAPYLMVAAAIKQIFSGIFNWLAEKINGIIDKLSSKPGLGWLKAFRLQSADASLSIAEQFKKDFKGIVDTGKALGESVMNVEFGFIQASSVKEGFAAIDAKSSISGENGIYKERGGTVINNFHGFTSDDVIKQVKNTIKLEVKASGDYSSR